MLINLRLGFASNSSSDHSIIFSKEKMWDCNVKNPMYFEWEQFICASVDAKMRYLASQLYCSFSSMMPLEAAKILALHLVGLKPPHMFKPTDLGIGVDHQSIFSVPKRVDGGINLEFITDLKKFFKRTDVVVLGGNDNEEQPRKKGKPAPFSRRSSLGALFDRRGDWVARKQNGVWTIFDRIHGTKISFTFDDGPVTGYKPETPELVDMKITEVCRNACDYCYQHSSVNGLHAEVEKIQYLMGDLRDMAVFEVVLGGGNVFMHPAFDEIIDISSNGSNMVSFTTKNPQEIVDHPKLMSMIYDHKIRRIAVSCSHTAEIDNLDLMRKKHGLSKHHEDQPFAVNIIFEQVCEFDVRSDSKVWKVPKDLLLKTMIERAWQHGFPVTLLGYKPCGAASMDNRMSQHPDRFAEILGSLLTNAYGLSEWAHLGIDTCLADRYSRKLKEAKVPSQLYYTRDGIRSWYIDAVQMKHGPSSYQPELLVDLEGEQLPGGRPITYLQDAITREFQKVKP